MTTQLSLHIVLENIPNGIRQKLTLQGLEGKK